MREIMIASTSIPRGWIDDQCLTTDASTPRINLLFDIGKRCTQELRKNRPEMEKVLDNFEASLHIETECRGDPQKIARCDNGMISSTSPDNVAPGLAWVENHFTKEKDPNHITACEDIRGPSQWDQDEIMSKESTDYNIPDMSRFD